MSRAVPFPKASFDPQIQTSGPKRDLDCAFVEGPMHLADLLAAASPSRARRFAVAMHERACGAQDDARLAFWAKILEHLAADAIEARLVAPASSADAD